MKSKREELEELLIAAMKIATELNLIWTSTKISEIQDQLNLAKLHE